jgi:hypothetical protein
MSRLDEDFIAALRADIVSELVRMTGAPETYVIPFAARIIAATQTRAGGTKVYIRPPSYDAAAVLADYRYNNGPEVCAKHDISRRTLQRLVAKRDREERRRRLALEQQ